MSQTATPLPTKVFTTVAELTPVLDEVLLLDVRYMPGAPGYGQQEHDKCRPRGAIFADIDGPLKDKNSTTGARHALPRADDFVAWCESLGIGKRPVVTFDGASGGCGAGRCWWMLVNLGVPNVTILDGGIHAYKAAGLPVVGTEAEAVPGATGAGAGAAAAEAATAPAAATSFDAPWEPGTWPFAKAWSNTITMDEVIASSTAAVFDSRPAPRYASAAHPGGPDPVGGHILFADGRESFSFPFTAALTTDVPFAPDARLKPLEQLREEYTAVLRQQGCADPASDTSTVIASCGSGVTACLVLSVFAALGWPLPRLYAGSFSEYQTVRFDVQSARQIEQQGYCLRLSKVAPTGETLGQEAGPIEIDGQNHASVAAALAAMGDAGGDAEVLGRALPLMRRGEEGTLFTANRGYELKCPN